MNNYPILTTEKLLLKPINENDYNDMLTIYTNEDLCTSLFGRFIRQKTSIYKDVFEIALLIGDYFIIRLKEEDKFIGCIVVDKFNYNKTIILDDIGLKIILLPEYQGRDLETEALKKVMDFVFMGIKAPKIHVNDSPQNSALAEVVKKCGFTFHDSQYHYLKEDYKDNDEEKNVYDYQYSPYNYENPIRKIDNITYTDDVHLSLCGQSVIAMLAKLPVAEVVNTTKNGGESFDWYMENALRYYGFRHIRRRIKITNDVVLPELCILLMKAPEWNYWSLYHKGIYYDPKFGVFSTPPVDAVFLSCYWEVFVS